MSIAKLLDELASQRETLEGLRSDLEAQAPELAAAIKAQAATVEGLEKDIKAKAQYVPDSQAHTLVGRLLQLVWTAAKPVLDEGKVTALCAANGLSTDGLYTAKPGFWSIRKRAAK